MKFLASLIVSLFLVSSQASDNGNLEQNMVHLLSYLSVDYPAAVKKGKVVNKFEYNEMLEFSSELKVLNKSSKVLKTLDQDFLNLDNLVKEKASKEKIFKLATQIKNKIIKTAGLVTTPSDWPKLSQGKSLYSKNCSSCHGDTGLGDGEKSRGLEPSPSNFTAEKALGVSPYQAFNTISLGVGGTSMKAFTELSQEDKWNLAFYINTFRHRGEKESALSLEHSPSLEEVATSSDLQLLEKYKTNAIVSSIRNFNFKKVLNVRFYLEKVDHHLKASLGLVKSNDYESAKEEALMAYLEGFEPVERLLKSKDKELLYKVEVEMGALRALIKNKNSFEKVSLQVTELQGLLGTVSSTLNVEESNQMSFWISFGIFIREALESLLVIVTLLTLLRGESFKGAKTAVHTGWISALAIGFGVYLVSEKFTFITGQSSEFLEGALSIFAALILIYVGFWFHRKSHMQNWTGYIKSKLASSLDNKSLIGIGLLSFTAVFREVFETILFINILKIEYGTSSYIGLALGLTFLLTFLAGWIILKFSVRFPLHKLLKVSTVMIFALAFIMAGKGINALQAVGKISSTQLFNFGNDLLGIYANVESLGAQATVTIICLFIYFYKQKEAAIE